MSEPMAVYNSLDEAFKFFNTELFNNELPPLLITFRADKGAHGYFSPDRLTQAESKVHELALNLTSSSRPAKEVLSTLVHEMVHLWQEAHGKPGKGLYHNREWANAMIAIGLIPYVINNPAKMTGTRVSHSIEEGGPFDMAATQLLASGWTPGIFEPEPETADQAARRVQQRKIKYMCNCPAETKAWGKVELRIACLECGQQMEAQ